MRAFRSLLLSAISLLVYARVDFANAELYECDMPVLFSVENPDHSIADFYQSRLSVNVPDENFAILAYPKGKTVTFKVHNVVVNFAGNVVYDTAGKRKASPKPLQQTFHDRIAGVAQRLVISSTDSDISDCHVYLLPTGEESGINVTRAIANDVRRVAESCVHSLVCVQLGKLNARARMTTQLPKSLALLPGLTGLTPYVMTYFGPSPVEHALMEIVDEGLKNLATEGVTLIQVPRIDQRFTLSDSSNTVVHMEATNGTLRDLTALTRTSIPTVSHDGLRFTISSQFSINAPRIHYDYRVIHGGQLSLGKMTATIDAVDLVGSAVADYSVVPCQFSIEHLKVTNFRNVINHRSRGDGEVNFVPKTSNWFTKRVLNSIGRTIEERLRYKLDGKVWSINCQKYRP